MKAMVRTAAIATALAMALAGCGDGAPGGSAEKDEAPPASLTPGQYEVTSEIVTLASTDKTTPATKLKQGDTAVVKACVAKDGTPDPALFAEAGDTCEATSSYISNGRMSIQLKCQRPGQSGQVMPTFDGKYTLDGFSGDAQGLTYFVADGDYRYTAEVTARRIGDCPAR
jgi:hypothetical protein